MEKLFNKYPLLIIVGFILLIGISSAFTTAEGRNGALYNQVVSVPLKQKHFLVTRDYGQALKLLKKGYVLQDVDISKGAYSEPCKHYTLVKY
jgi:hypothetical protein